MTVLRLLLFLSLFLIVTGCGDGGELLADDDDSAGDDDDTSNDDDAANDDDDATSDDDDTTGDDDDATGDDDDYVDVNLPSFGDCSGNQFKVGLGDGTELGPFEGFFDNPTSFANTTGSFTVRIGTDDVWVALNGNATSMSAGSPIPLQSPPSVAGNVVLQASLSELALGESKTALAGNYGLPASNLHPSVGGEVTFSSVPSPGTTASGTYSGTIQKIVGLSNQVILLGVTGCFEANLTATDG